MRGDELLHIGVLLIPALLATIVASALTAPLLKRTAIRPRLLSLALVTVLVSLANLGVLSALMFVKHDALVITALLVYSGGAGIAAALALSRSFVGGIQGLGQTASRLASGDLDARAGTIGGGPELEALASALDDMAAKLQISMGREKRAITMRNDLIIAVSHDLRTPLAGLRAMLEAIEDGIAEDPATVTRYVAQMRRAVDSLSLLVDDLFELVKLDAGAIEAEAERARLDEVVRTALAACNTQAVEKGLEVITAIDGAESILCSPRLGRVLQNLVQNAIRHTPSDGAVRVRARREDGWLEVAVEDSGEGIEPEALERVLEPFWRGDTARSYPGSGLGLALANRIVEALGGSIQIESEPNRGSKFAVLLPDRA
jgi:signal transduction histidine kinase